MMQVAIIGSGPAGLLAALAVEQAGHHPVIFSLAQKSPMFGAMYLHEPIPGLHQGMVEDFEINIMKVGSREGYAYNVYANRNAPCSWDHIPEGITPAWDLAETYDRLWDRYGERLRPYKVGPPELGAICKNYPLVFNSAPASAFCRHNHMFASQDIWVIHGEGIHLLEDVNDGNMMYYNGIPHDGSFRVRVDDDIDSDADHQYTKGHDWYRFSQINRYQAWEYSIKPDWEWEQQSRADPLARQMHGGKKPLGTDCDCFARGWDNYHRIGRFGRWEKGVLTHHAYRQAREVLLAL